MAHEALTQIPSPPRRRRLWSRPSTSEGRRALWLVVGGLALQPVTALLVRILSLPSAVGALSALGLLAMIVGGAFATIAVARHGERSILVLATLPLSLFLVFFVIAEFAFPH